MKNVKTSKFFSILFLIVGILLSLWIYKLIHDKQQQRIISELENELIDFEHKIDEKLISSGEVLFSVANLYSAVEKFTPEVFHQFTKQLIHRKESILIVEWQPLVMDSEKESFIRKAREMGMKNFDFWELDKDENAIKAKSREVHLPVLFAVSTDATANTIGLDLAFSPERMKSKWESLESGKPRTSQTFQVIMASPKKFGPTGFAITIPVFKRGTDPISLAERKQNIYGFVAAVFDVEKLLSHPMQDLASKGINLKIVDLVNDKVVLESEQNSPTTIFQRTKINVYGREWGIVVNAGKKFTNRFTYMWEYSIPVVFAFLFLVLFYFLEINRKKTLDLLETQEKLKVAANLAKAAAHSKAMFLSNMSHELRTPLSAILGYGELMKREGDFSNRSKYLDVIIRSGKHLAEVINDILDVSKLEDAKFKLNPKEFYLNSLISQLDELVVSQFNNPAVNYIKRIDPNVDEVLFGDEFRIKQMLINLLSNAFKFTRQGQVVLAVEKKVIDEENFKLLIEVSDTGKGIGLEFQKHIFDPFTQEDTSYSRVHAGTGLGLSIVSRLVKLMGGNIDLKSEVNQGSRFLIELPFKKNKAS